MAGKAGASPAAQAAVIRLNEEAEAANDRIAASELKGDFQQLVLDFTAINSRDHDQTLTDKSKELETPCHKRQKRLVGFFVLTLA